MPMTPAVRAMGCSFSFHTPRRTIRQIASSPKMASTMNASVLCVSMITCACSLCCTTSSAMRPAKIAAAVPRTPKTSVQNAAALSDSRLNTMPSRSNSTDSGSSAGGRSFTAAWNRGQS